MSDDNFRTDLECLPEGEDGITTVENDGSRTHKIELERNCKGNFELIVINCENTKIWTGNTK